MLRTGESLVLPRVWPYTKIDAFHYSRWGPLMGPGKVFDPSRFFVFCGNVLGSPYGSASPLTIGSDVGRPYGPEFPPTTIRDDVR